MSKMIEDQAYRRERIFFRFVDFSTEWLPSLKEALPEANLESKTSKRTGKLVVTFELEKAHDTRKLLDLIHEKKILPGDYGLWVSLVTENDSDGVHVPDFAAQFMREVGGQLDFSFTLA